MPGDDASGIDGALDALVTRVPRPVVARLARRPGQKEARFAHLLAGEVASLSEEPPNSTHGVVPDRIGALEETVRELRTEVAELRVQLEALRKQLE
jgi:uncharacterized protein YceH (UPF0502 family)